MEDKFNSFIKTLKVSVVFRAFYAGIVILIVMYAVDTNATILLIEKTNLLIILLLFFVGSMYWAIHRLFFGETFLYHFQIAFSAIVDLLSRKTFVLNIQNKKGKTDTETIPKYISDTLFFIDVLGISFFDIRAAYQQLLRQFYNAYDFPGKDVIKERTHTYNTDNRAERKEYDFEKKDIEGSYKDNDLKCSVKIEEKYDENSFAKVLKDTKDKIENEHTDIHLFYVAAEVTLFGYLFCSSGFFSTTLPPRYIFAMGLLSLSLFIFGMISEIRQHALETRIYVRLYSVKDSRDILISYLKMYNFEPLMVKINELSTEEKTLSYANHTPKELERLSEIKQEYKYLSERIRKNKHVSCIMITIISIVALGLFALFIWHLYSYYQIISF
ncbi:MAG: hypothetical protein KA140_07185 [Caldisericia bacterium]|nr:hypothetical protein [Caldisericia bacterium]